MPKIAHISDIHFGKTFNVEVWKNVRTRIEEFRPDLLVVSGDLVDHPWPFHMLAVKAELMDLCAKCPSRPELFVVPGNHDVRLWGNIRLRLRPRWLERIVLPNWFERIMFSDITGAKAKIEAALGISLGINEDCRKLSWGRWFKRLNPKNSLRRNVKCNRCDKRLQSCDRRHNGSAWPTESLHSRIAIVCFDSNPSKGRRLRFASGEVGQEQITRLDRGRRTELRITCPSCGAARNATGADAVLMRIAVLHHHPLPIALPAASFRSGEREARLEPYLVLTNSGDLLQQLQKHKFDLVLHGHRHRPQFARLELNSDTVDPYPLTVLAAGSTAKTNEEKAHNTLRLIETEPNGRLTVRTVERGEPWSGDDPPYREELSKLKQRAFSRARERTKRIAGLLRWENTIDAVGNVSITTEVSKFRLLHGADAVDGFPFLVTVPLHAQRFNDLIQLDPEYRDAMRLMWRAEDNQLYDFDRMPQNQQGYCWIGLKQRLEPGRTIDYRIHHAVSNSIAMNTWELAERARVDPARRGRDFESVWRYVGYPTDRLRLRLVLPPNLSDVRPEFRCRRAPRYPDFPLTFLPEIAMKLVMRDAKHGDFDHFEVDEDLQKEEQHKLRYHPHERAWEIDIEYPVPGYIYELRWNVPTGDVANDRVRARTNVRQKMLLSLLGRLRRAEQPAEHTTDSELSDADHECCHLFEQFACTQMRELAGPDRDERQAVFLMVYDRNDLQLHPVRSCLSWQERVPDSFSVPLGGGIAGAAFLHTKVLAWGKEPDSKTLIRPEPLPGLDAQYVLALPIFYVGKQGSVDKTGAVIGVVTVGSDSAGSKIADLRGDSQESVDRRREIQVGAQAVVRQMLNRLSRYASPGPRPNPDT